MDAGLNIWSLAAIIIVSMLIGFWAGMAGRRRERDGGQAERLLSGRPGNVEYEYMEGRAASSDREESKEESEVRPVREEKDPARTFHRREGKRIPLGWAIGSPIGGAVSYFYEGTTRGVIIKPDQGKLYAPAPGKITRLYPTGNSFRLRTEFGVELYIQAGERTGELEGLYFRPRVVQNEIVQKGKLLLEYDLQGVEEEGYDPSIRMSVEDAEDYQNISVTETVNVKTGEDLMWVCR